MVLSLLLSGNAYADKPKIVKFYCEGGTNGDLNNFEINEISNRVIWSFKYPGWKKFKTENLKIKSTDGKKVVIEGFKGKPWDYETAEKFERNFGANNFKCKKTSDTSIVAEKPKKQEPVKEQYEKYQVKLDNCITEDKNLKEKFVVYKHDYLINYKKDNVAVTAYRKPNKPYDDGSYKKVF